MNVTLDSTTVMKPTNDSVPLQEENSNNKTIRIIKSTKQQLQMDQLISHGHLSYSASNQQRSERLKNQNRRTSNKVYVNSKRTNQERRLDPKDLRIRTEGWLRSTEKTIQNSNKNNMIHSQLSRTRSSLSGRGFLGNDQINQDTKSSQTTKCSKLAVRTVAQYGFSLHYVILSIKINFYYY